jgi:hypothetical protein
MINKKILLLVALLATVAKADDRVGHYDAVELRNDALTSEITVKSPNNLSTSYTLQLPGNDGDNGQSLTTDGSGVTSWSGPYALSGANSDITSLTGLNLRLVNQYGFITNESTVAGDGCYLFTESNNDTGMCSPSDGIISFYGNSAIGAQVSNVGISQIRGVDYVWPNSQAASANYVLTNDGAGNLSWAEGGGGLLSISDNYDTNLGSSNRNQISQNHEPTANNNNSVSALVLNNNVTADFDIGTITSLDMNINNNQDGDTNINRAINIGHTVGRDDIATTTTTVQSINSYTNLESMATVDNFTAINLGTNADVGSSFGDLRGYTFYGSADTVTNFYSAFEVGGSIENFSNGTLFNMYPSLGTQAENSYWQTYKDSTSFVTMDNFQSITSYVTGTETRNDFAFIDTGNSIDTVGRNYNILSFHDQIGEVNAYFNSYQDTTRIDNIVGGSVNGINLGFTLSSVPNDVTGINVAPTVTQRGLTSQIEALTVVGDSSSNLAGEFFRKCTAFNENPNTCYKFWYSVDAVGPAPTANGDTLVEISLVEDDPANTVALATAVAVDGTALLSASATGPVVNITTDTAGKAGTPDVQIPGFSWSFVQGGGGDGQFRGIQFGGANISGYTDENIIAFDSGGYRVNFGQLSAYKQSTIVPAIGGNPTVVHVTNSDLSLGDGQTVADADYMGVGGIGNVTIGDGSTVTSGALGIGATAQGKISLITVGAGSTLQDSRSDMAIQVFSGGSGTITNSNSYRAGVANFGASGTMVNYRAFLADSVTGVVATNQWGLYAKDIYQNYMGGQLKIGGSANGVNDLVQSTNAGLEIEEKHVRSIGTSPTPAVQAAAGTGSSCTVSNATDVAGTINLTTTNTASSSGDQCVISFNLAYDVAPICIFSPKNAVAGSSPSIVGPYMSSTTTTVSLAFATAEPTGQTYQWTYHCIETN